MLSMRRPGWSWHVATGSNQPAAKRQPQAAAGFRRPPPAARLQGPRGAKLPWGLYRHAGKTWRHLNPQSTKTMAKPGTSFWMMLPRRAQELSQKLDSLGPKSPPRSRIALPMIASTKCQSSRGAPLTHRHDPSRKPSPPGATSKDFCFSTITKQEAAKHDLVFFLHTK